MSPFHIFISPFNFHAIAKSSKCLCCKAEHPHTLNKCNKFLRLFDNDRIEFVKKNRICFNCLSFITHGSRTYTVNYSCNICSRHYNVLLHFQKKQKKKTNK